ncbi:ParB/RepB/Spo0J family partition protein [Candidatus Parcubacteria bacterium]|nr:MAG: ParB/RepB/Spo0J family partition protein [Candidatus Parcubacteria bacterium]
MLGKGLESLIPPKKSDTDGDAARPNPVAPPPTSMSAPQPGVSGKAEEEPKSPARQEPRREEDSIFHIEVFKIKPNRNQPRRAFDEEAIQELAASIREFGFLQPLVVTKIEKETPAGLEVEYELIAGERRLLAAKLLGLEHVPAIIRKVNLEQERLELAIIENLQREDLNPIEKGRAFSRLQEEFRLTQREIASRLGKSREVVANTMRLLDLPPFIQEALQKNQITESHGRLLLAIGDPGAQKKLFEDLLAHRLTTRELKNRVQSARSGEAAQPPPDLAPELKILEEKLSTELGTPVSISKNGDTGKITISFYSQEELQSIVRRLEGEEEKE